MSISYRTSNSDYDVIVPLTQQQFLAMRQNPVPNIYGSYAPDRNHPKRVMLHDNTHDFYFTPNYDYDRNGIPEYEQVVIINEGGGGTGEDRYSTFVVNENNKTLTISYNS